MRLLNALGTLRAGPTRAVLHNGRVAGTRVRSAAGSVYAGQVANWPARLAVTIVAGNTEASPAAFGQTDGISVAGVSTVDAGRAVIALPGW